MKIFLSWSGPHSRAIAEALNDWLRRVIQAVKPFYSPEIEKGAKWSNEIDAALEGTSFGIICLTPDNLNSPWIHFEAGALSKTPGTLIWTFLCGLTAADVPPPLGRFQHTIAEKEDTLQLVKTINRRLTDAGVDPLPETLLADNFNLFWPQLEKKLGEVTKAIGKGLPKETRKGERGTRDERAILDEILELSRNQERRLVALEVRGVARPQSIKPRRLDGFDGMWLEVSRIADAEKLSKTLQQLLPNSKVTLLPSSKLEGGAELQVELEEPVHEIQARTYLSIAARTAEIPEPDYVFVRR